MAVAINFFLRLNSGSVRRFQTLSCSVTFLRQPSNQEPIGALNLMTQLARQLQTTKMSKRVNHRHIYVDFPMTCWNVTSVAAILQRHSMRRSTILYLCESTTIYSERTRVTELMIVNLRTSLSWVRLVFVASWLSYSLTLRQLRSYSLTWGSYSYSVTSTNRKDYYKSAQCEPGLRPCQDWNYNEMNGWNPNVLLVIS